MSIRVLHSTHCWLPRSQSWLYDQIRFLPRDVVSVVACDAMEQPELFPVPELTRSPLLRRALDRLLRKRGFERACAFRERTARLHGAAVLHSHFGWTAWLDAPTARRAGLAHVVSFYGTDVSLPGRCPEWGPRYRELFSAADVFLCEGPRMAAALVALGCPPDKLRLHPLGVDLDAIPFTDRSRGPGEPLRVLMAAAFREAKGLPSGIEALGLVRGELPLELTIVGGTEPTASSRREGRRIDEALRRHLPGVPVERTGFLPLARLRAAASRHHVFLCPSATASDGEGEGGLPVTLLEMAAAGLLVVATRHDDIPEAVIPEETGLLAEERDARGLAACLRRLASRPQSWPHMARRARRRVMERFDARVQGERLRDIYARALSGS